MQNSGSGGHACITQRAPVYEYSNLADARHEAPLHGLAVPHVLRVAAERLFFVEGADDERRVAGEQHRDVPARRVRCEERNVREQVTEIDRMPHDPVQSALHHAAVRRQQAEAVAERDLPAHDNQQADAEQHRRRRFRNDRRESAPAVLRSGNVIDTAVTSRTSGRLSTIDAGRRRHVSTTTSASPTSSSRSVARPVSMKSPSSRHANSEEQRADKDPRPVLARSRGERWC